jgi:hypothetical protein
MAQSWYEDLPEDAFVPEATQKYRLEINRVREGLAKGLGFEEASAAIEEKDEGLRHGLIEDALKVLIAEEHFSKGVPLEKMAARLKLPVEQLESAKQSMLDEIVGDPSMRQFFNETEH